MARIISFNLTTPQFVDRTKDVTRRLGWFKTKPGDVLRAVEKAQGLKLGEKAKELGFIRVISIRREKLGRMLEDEAYGFAECVREGFAPPHPCADPAQFVSFFCKSHKDCTVGTEITRIEFEHVEKP